MESGAEKYIRVPGRSALSVQKSTWKALLYLKQKVILVVPFNMLIIISNQNLTPMTL